MNLRISRASAECLNLLGYKPKQSQRYKKETKQSKKFAETIIFSYICSRNITYKLTRWIIKITNI